MADIKVLPGATAPEDGLTPERLWERLLRLSADERLEWLRILLDGHRVAGRCFVEDHVGRLAELTRLHRGSA